MTARPEPCKLLAATDLMTSSAHLMEAVFMAASSLDTDEAGAIQNVCEEAKRRIQDAICIVKAITAEGVK